MGPKFTSGWCCDASIWDATYVTASYGSVVNEVKLTYNGWAQVTKSEQEHAGAVVGGTTKAVQYGYGAGTGSTFPRSSNMIYPSGRVVYFKKPASGIGAAINRLDNVADDASGTTKYAQYDYLGNGTIMTAKRPAVTNRLQPPRAWRHPAQDRRWGTALAESEMI